MKRPHSLRRFLAAVSGSALAFTAYSQTQYILVEADTLTGRSGTILTDVNDHGQLVGYYPVSTTRDRPFLWNGGRLTELPLFPNQIGGRAERINNAGTIIGSSHWILYGLYPTRWVNGTPELALADDTVRGAFTAINEAGDLTGWAFDGDSDRYGISVFGSTESSFYTNAIAAIPTAINANRQIVGTVQTSSSAPGVAFLREGGSNRLIQFNNPLSSSAAAINDQGQVTGSGSTLTNPLDHAFRYELIGGLGQMEDLNPPDAVTSAGNVITADGTVYGSAQWTAQDHSRAMLLDGEASVRIADFTIGADHANLGSIIAANANGWLISRESYLTNSGSEPPPPTYHYLLVPRTTATSWFSNLSVRAPLAAGSTLIVGTSSIGSPRDVLVRGIGPGLEPYMPVGTSLATDPRLTVFGAGQTELAANDNWDATGGTADAITAAQAFPLTPGSTDAATVATINGPTTAHVLAQDTGGIGLVELYNVIGSDATNRIVNLSARYEVGTGENILIAGFIITGNGPKTVVIRGIGPGLAQYDVPNPLADPQIALHDNSGQRIAANDDWSANLGSVFSAVGAFAIETGSKDAAMVLPLWPGLYTVHLTGVGGTTGQGLIEIYDLDL